MPIDEIPLPGEHNISNVLAARGGRPALRHRARRDPAARSAISSASSIGSSPSPFVDGVTFVNDSQGTQPDASIAALRSFEPPIVLIAGGRGKNVSIDALAREVARRAAAVVRHRRDRGRIRGRVRQRPARSASSTRHDLEGAVRRADAIARELGRRHRAAEPSRGQLRHVRRLRRARRGVQGHRRPHWRGVRAGEGREGRRRIGRRRRRDRRRASPDAPRRIRSAGRSASGTSPTGCCSSASSPWPRWAS